MVTNPRTSPLDVYKTMAEKKTDQHPSDNIRESKFSDRYKEKNVNALRHLFMADKKVSNQFQLILDSKYSLGNRTEEP